MDAWIPITVAAAAAQTLRFMAQKQLKQSGLSSGGATWARFLYSTPLVVAIVAYQGLNFGHAFPPLPTQFWAYAVMGGAAQIFATICVVSLFGHRNFAVGITFKKTEVMLTAIAGFVILGDRISLSGAFALLLGFVGVLWLSEPPGGPEKGIGRYLNRASGIGLLSGLFFALSAIGYRGAVLAVDSGDTAFRAGLTLAIVTLMQTIGLGIWLWLRESGQIGAVLRNWRVAGVVGIFSMLGSYGWFAAFSLQNAAYVFAVGQVELIFSLLATTLFFREPIATREIAGMAVITGSILILVLLA